jgi:indolepyruvate ferredoxin oxidoreductase
MGFAQKFGPVLSYLRIGNQPADINQVRIEPARADALIGCDLVVSSSPKASITYQKDHTRALLNTAEMLTGDFVRHRDASLNADERVAAVEDAVGQGRVTTIDANRLARRLMGDSIYANILMVGCAWQQGLIPVSLDALLRAIELNGIKIDENKQAFTWGRIAAANAGEIVDLLGENDSGIDETLDEMIARRRDFLVEYQDTDLAEKYAALVGRVREAEKSIADDEVLSRSVAAAYFRLLSYKDEYEVARLHTRPEFLQTLRDDYGSKAKLRFHLAPPLFSRKKDARGRPLKKEFGAWMLPVFRLLAGMRGLRGTPFDLFGYTAERRMERGLILEFEDLLESALAGMTVENRDILNGNVSRYLELRGYGPVKEAAVEKMRA